MKVKLICIGSTKKSFYQEAELFYQERIKRYMDIQVIYLPDVKGMDAKLREKLKELEGQQILKQLQSSDQVILLDERGKDYNSKEMSLFIQQRFNLGGKQLAFIIGGAYGFSEGVYNRADAKIRLSSMTFSHELARLVFLEQFYRSMTILKGEPYHHF
jgi:23S rRNA (pseudouridine1915-N3)-methyltransferase